jgi:hypothetical protein
MAQYTVKHTCGHTQSVNLFGTGNERERKMGWMRSQKCPDCVRANQTEARAALAEVQGWANLIGSEKQIAWALTIRAKKLPELEQLLATATEQYTELAADVSLNEQTRGNYETIVKGVEHMRTEPDAKWWIDHRDDYARALILAAAGQGE